MNYELKRIIPFVIISLILIRVWIEVITTTVLKDSQLIDEINNNKIGFHHYQFGLVALIIVVVFRKFLKNYLNYLSILEGIALALIIDQYTYILSALGIHLPFDYRSQKDYLVEIVLILLFISSWFFLDKKAITEKE